MIGKNLYKDIATVLASLLLFAVLSVMIIRAVHGVFGIDLADSAHIFQAVATVAIIGAGAVMAYRKLQIFRDFEPHLTITHDVSHRFIGDQYVHILVTANLHNSSKVVIRPRKSLFLLLQLSPIDDDEVERLYRQVFTDRSEKDLQWPLLDRIERTGEENRLSIEPGETHKELCEFILSKDVESIIITTYFSNPAASENNAQDTIGWGVASVYDMLDSVE